MLANVGVKADRMADAPADLRAALGCDARGERDGSDSTRLGDEQLWRISSFSR